MKKIITLVMTFLGIFFIYCTFNNHHINYVSIGDNIMNNNLNNINYNQFIKDFLTKKKWLSSFNTSYYNNSVLSLYRDLLNNRTIKNNDEEYYFKKVLRESDILVISVGMEELSKNYSKNNMTNNYLYFEKMYQRIERLVNEIKKYAKGKILFIGYYNPTNYYDAKTDEFFYDINTKLNRLMMNNGITYIDLYELIKGNSYKDNINSISLNNEGYKKLASIIEFYLD